MKRILKEKYLYNRLKKQDQDSFAQVYDLFVEKIYRFIYFKVSNQEEAQDLTSEVFLKAWNASQDAGQVTGSTLPAFLYKIARNVVIDHYRQKKQDISLEAIMETGEEPRDTDGLVEKFDIKLDLAILEKVMMELKDEYREIIVMRYIDELSTTEIADILGKTKGNVRVLQSRAIEAVKRLLNQK